MEKKVGKASGATKSYKSISKKPAKSPVKREDKISAKDTHSKATLAKNGVAKNSLVKASTRLPKVNSGQAVLRKFDYLQDQLSLIHGVMEELCERQEAMAAWHMECAKQTISRIEELHNKVSRLKSTDLFDVQSAALEEVVETEVRKKKFASGGNKALAQRTSDLERFVESEGTFFDETESFEDKMSALNEATEFLLELSEDLSERRELREKFMEKRQHSRENKNEKKRTALPDEPASTLILSTGKPIYH